MQSSPDLIPANVQDAIDRIPPEAWPLIDIACKVTVAIALVWIFLALVAWWRRRAYNLTIASTAKRNKDAQPDFLTVDKKAREAAIERGAAHEADLTERERQEAIAAAAGLSKGSHVARMALSYLHNQADQGTSCPLTMTYAAVPAIASATSFPAMPVSTMPWPEKPCRK